MLSWNRPNALLARLLRLLGGNSLPDAHRCRARAISARLRQRSSSRTPPPATIVPSQAMQLMRSPEPFHRVWFLVQRTAAPPSTGDGPGGEPAPENVTAPARRSCQPALPRSNPHDRFIVRPDNGHRGHQQLGSAETIRRHLPLASTFAASPHAGPRYDRLCGQTHPLAVGTLGRISHVSWRKRMPAADVRG